jgi:dTDP-4-dehydrorhamnose 3,5-epimerase
MMSSEASMKLESARLAAGEGLELAYPQCEKGIGAVIQAPDSPHLITGVRVRPYPIYADDRGYFLEVVRTGRDLVAQYARAQVATAVGYPGTIKGFHYHLRQHDCWTAVAGMLQVALADLRQGSPTFGARNTLYVGTLRPWQILIPPGGGHGYKIIGRDPAVLVYVTDQFYDPADEGRLAFDDPHVNYDWETQHK